MCFYQVAGADKLVLSASIGGISNIPKHNCHRMYRRRSGCKRKQVVAPENDSLAGLQRGEMSAGMTLS